LTYNGSTVSAGFVTVPEIEASVDAVLVRADPSPLNELREYFSAFRGIRSDDKRGESLLFSYVFGRELR
jgi:hypothetical protein